MATCTQCGAELKPGTIAIFNNTAESTLTLEKK